MPGSAREEAERLVAAFLARASAGGHSSGDGFGPLGESVMGLLASAAAGSWSTGSAECCVCPVCKAIAAVRDPGPETAERLAGSVGDIATGVAGLMRALSALGGDRPRSSAPRPRPQPSPDQAWSSATRAPGPEAASPVVADPAAPDETADPWGAASAADAREAAVEAERARARREAERARAREEAAAARARAAAAERAVARAVEQARAAAESTRTGDVWAAATAEVAVSGPDAPRSVDHELGAAAPEDRDTGTGDDARPGGAV